LASDIQDDGFREIQLNGKQLVFVFMAVTALSAAIFLCGVFVGRGVRAERGEVAADASALNAAQETTPRQVAPAVTPAPGSDPTVAQAPPAVDDLSYFNRLQKTSPPAESLKPAPAAVPPPSPKAPARAPTPAPAAAPASATTQGQGWAVQVAALNARPEADAVAKRLSAKGYAAFVLPPATGTPMVFRVRVGKFGTKREAETVAAKLQKEEQFKPWITR
jgi:cell division septation protein DedD